jgi:Domain of unknown function (DUF4149)
MTMEHMPVRPGVSTLELVLLALWLGAAGFFSAAVAPALFAVLPTRTLAGAAVGRMLPVVFYAGMILGVALTVLQVMARRQWTFGAREIAGVVMAGACAISQLLVSPRIERLRAEIGGPLESLAAADPRRAAFGRLHGISVGWLGLAMIAAVVALIVAGRALNADATRMS